MGKGQAVPPTCAKWTWVDVVWPMARVSRPNLHQRRRFLSGADVSCDNYFCPSAPFANDDDAVLAPGGSVVLDVLANDIDVEGYGLSLAS